MKYALLSADDQRGIRMSHVRDLEAAHYRLSLEESEEPGSNPNRRAMLIDIERRVAAHRAVLDPAPVPTVDEATPAEFAPPEVEPE